MKEKLKIVCDRIGMGVLWGCYLTILVAIFFSTGHPDRIIVVGFNWFGEYTLELFLLCGTFPLIFNMILKLYEKTRREWKQLNENPLRI